MSRAWAGEQMDRMLGATDLRSTVHESTGKRASPRTQVSSAFTLRLAPRVASVNPRFPAMLECEC